MPFKELLHSIHDVVRFILHAALTPVIAALRGIDSIAQHLISELGKI